MEPSTRKTTFVSDGEPTPELSEDVESIQFTVHDFANRTEQPGEAILSPRAKAHGYEWCAAVYPRGWDNTHSEYVSFWIELCGPGDTTASVSFCCKAFETRANPIKEKIWYPLKLVKRKDILNSFLEDDGSLIVRIDIRIAVNDRRTWYPKELERQEILVNMYRNASSSPTSDVTFAVGEATHHAHKAVLELRCHKLYEISAEVEGNKVPIPIPSVRPEIFRSLLDFVYTVQLPEIETADAASELLVAADRFDCVDLKLYAESVLVDRFVTVGSAASLLLLADAHSCALLEEAVLRVFVTRPAVVRRTEAWPRVTESNRLLQKLLDRLVSHVDATTGANDDETRSEADRLDVTALRKKLEAADLELDGSREVLVDRLQNHQKSIAGP